MMGADAGLIAVDKVANKVRFYDPATLRETKVLEFAGADRPRARALRPTASTPSFRFMATASTATTSGPTTRSSWWICERQAIHDVIDLGEHVAPHGMAATRDGKLWVVCDIPNKLLCVDIGRRAVEAVYDCPAKGPHLVTLLPDESKLYVSAKEGDLAVFDLARRAFTAAHSDARRRRRRAATAAAPRGWR